MQRRILYIDDDDMLREIVLIWLGRESDLEVRTADSGITGLTLVREWKPDLVLLDVQMPGLDGPETLRSLRGIEGAETLPVLFITAFPTDAEVTRLMALGAVGVLAKPFGPDALLQQIGEAITR